MDKPWLECPSVKEIRDRTHKSPLLWPRKTNINEYRAMLRKGKARPSPGPDRWEKWIVKALPDNVLNAVLTLHNYIVINNRFPGEIRKTIACPIFKKGTITHLSNRRGIPCTAAGSSGGARGSVLYSIAHQELT